MEQTTGIEPVFPAWEAGVLPINYICKQLNYSFVNTIYLTNNIIHIW